MTLPRILFIVFSAFLITSNASASDRGLHNDTKNFTPPEAMSRSDWSNPTEMHRAWQHALVRVPTGKNRSRKLTTAKLPGWNAGLPPLKWSSAMFRKTEEDHGEQAPEARRDCHEVAAG